MAPTGFPACRDLHGTTVNAVRSTEFGRSIRGEFYRCLEKGLRERLNSLGVMPTCFLKAELKTDLELNPGVVRQGKKGQMPRRFVAEPALDFFNAVTVDEIVKIEIQTDAQDWEICRSGTRTRPARSFMLSEGSGDTCPLPCSVPISERSRGNRTARGGTRRTAGDGDARQIIRFDDAVVGQPSWRTGG